jgi:signal transduction histidine kinase
MAKKAATKSENLINKMKEVVEIITKGGRELEEVNVRNIAEEIISTYAGIGIQFDLKGKGSARADVALGSVIDNIISNALKHSETDTISITIKSSKESCVIEIADNGKGIPD